jgi:hypothetical protein
LPGLCAAACQPAVSGAGQQVAGAVGACRAQGLVQGQGLGGRDDAVIVAVQEQERGGAGPDQVDRVGFGGAVSVDRVTRVGEGGVQERSRLDGQRRPRSTGPPAPSS